MSDPPQDTHNTRQPPSTTALRAPVQTKALSLPPPPAPRLADGKTPPAKSKGVARPPSDPRAMDGPIPSESRRQPRVNPWPWAPTRDTQITRNQLSREIPTRTKCPSARDTRKPTTTRTHILRDPGPPQADASRPDILPPTATETPRLPPKWNSRRVQPGLVLTTPSGPCDPRNPTPSSTPMPQLPNSETKPSRDVRRKG